MIKKKDGFLGEQQVVLSPMLINMQEADPLTSSLFITDIGYYPKAEHHHRIREQAIDQYVLIYCVDGSGFYVVDGKRYEVEKNQYFILPAGKPHEYGVIEGKQWTIYWLHFRGEHASIFADGAVKPQNIKITINSRIKDRLDIFEEILHILYTGEGIEDFRYASSLLHHFLASMRYLQQFRSSTVSTLGRGSMSPTEAAIHYMRENIENRITLADVLKYVGYSQSHFSSLFKKNTGMSPLAYFNKLKIERACELLNKTDLKINQICYKIGIDDPFYFSRLFSKTIGMSPTKYKEIRT